MKKFVVLLVLSMAACTFTGNNETPPVQKGGITPRNLDEYFGYGLFVERK